MYLTSFVSLFLKNNCSILPVSEKRKKKSSTVDEIQFLLESGETNSFLSVTDFGNQMILQWSRLIVANTFSLFFIITIYS